MPAIVSLSPAHLTPLFLSSTSHASFFSRLTHVVLSSPISSHFDSARQQNRPPSLVSQVGKKGENVVQAADCPFLFLLAEFFLSFHLLSVCVSFSHAESQEQAFEYWPLFWARMIAILDCRDPNSLSSPPQDVALLSLLLVSHGKPFLPLRSLSPPAASSC